MKVYFLVFMILAGYSVQAMDDSYRLPQKAYSAPEPRRVEANFPLDDDPNRIAKSLLYFDYNPGSTRREFKQSLLDALEKHKTGLVYSSVWARLGDVSREEQDVASASKYYLTAYNHEQGLPEARSWAALQLGYIYICQMRYKDAVAYLKASEKNLHPVYVPKLYTLLGVAQYCIGNKKNAFECWKKVIKSDNQREKAHAYHNVAMLLEDYGQFKEALPCLQKARSLGRSYKKGEFEQYVSKWQSAIKSGSLK